MQENPTIGANIPTKCIFQAPKNVINRGAHAPLKTRPAIPNTDIPNPPFATDEMNMMGLRTDIKVSRNVDRAKVDKGWSTSGVSRDLRDT